MSSLDLLPTLQSPFLLMTRRGKKRVILKSFRSLRSRLFYYFPNVSVNKVKIKRKLFHNYFNRRKVIVVPNIFYVNSCYMLKG